jgi:hypothetical protein
MKQLKKDLQVISKNLKMLTQKTENIIRSLDKLEKVQTKTAAGKRRADKGIVAKQTATRKGKSTSGTETVLKIIMRSKRGVDTAAIHNKTGYNTRKIWDIVHRAYKEGKIKKAARGTYVKA